MDDETRVHEKEAPVENTETAETQSNEASSPAQEAPKATPTEEVKSEEVKAEETAEEQLYAGKYKSVEELEKAYRSASSEASRIASDRAELSRMLEESFTAPEPATAQDIEEPSYDEASPETERITKLERNQAVANFVFAHPDADGKSVNEILQKDPLVKNITGYDAKLEYAYLKSQNMVQSKTVAEAQKTAATQTQAKYAEKQAAQVETAKGQAQPAADNKELSKDQIRNAMRNEKSFDELIKSRFPGVNQMRSRQNR